MGVGETGATIIAWTTKETEVYNTPILKKNEMPLFNAPFNGKKG